jgi:hypothetical protein
VGIVATVNRYAERVAEVQERLVAHLFEAAMSVTWALVGVAYLTDHGIALDSPVGRDVGGFETAWSWLYVLACPLILYGLLRGPRDWRFRVAGLILLATGLVMHGVAAVTFHLEPRVAIYGIYAAACVLRAWFVVHLLRPPVRGPDA